MSAPQTRLELRGITVQVPDGEQTLTILDDVDLALRAGESAALSGASGSGKSTLLAVAALLRAPLTGTVAIDGEVVDARRRAAAARARRRSVGLVTQSANLFPALTALEQLELVAHLDGRSARAARPAAVELLERVGLGHRLGHRPHQLSGGERQRVNLARSLMSSPTILLADEPTASLDPERGAAVFELLRDTARERQLAMLVVTHDPAEMNALDRHLRIEHGTVRELAASTPAGE